MKINLWQIPRAILTLRSAIKPIGETKDWYTSSSIIYQLIVSGLVVLSALGIYLKVPEEQIKEVSAAIVIIVPTLLKLIDALIAIRLRVTTTVPISGTVAAKKAIEDSIVPIVTTTIKVPIGSTLEETIKEVKQAEIMSKEVK